MVYMLQAVSVPDPSREFCLFLLLPDPNCSSVCRASTAFRMSTQMWLCYLFTVNYLCERYVWVVGVKLHDNDIFRL